MFNNKSLKSWISILFRLLLMIAATITIIKGDWLNLGLTIITFILTFLPSILSKRLKHQYPSEFEILIVFFIYTSIFFGGVLDFYLKFWWWDLFLHTLSGVIIGVIGFSLVYSLNKEYKPLKLSAGFVAMFAFSFAIALGALWEIFEFSMDQFFGVNMQKRGLVDTMWDLIVDSLGGGFVSMMGYFYLKNEKFKKYINLKWRS
ncbi:hypothetical protein KKA15_02670 [Patescibacteria group bacterium]|nr:hypothetical protein [Patescibacteria group bacterium]